MIFFYFLKKGTWIGPIPIVYKIGNNEEYQTNNCKYLDVISNKGLNWSDHVSKAFGKNWSKLHFINKVLKKISKGTKEIAYRSLMRPFMEYGASGRLRSVP